MASGDVKRITKMYNTLMKESENIVNSVISLCYFMRGGISYDDLMFRTPGERDLISRFIDSRLESESNKINPVY